MKRRSLITLLAVVAMVVVVVFLRLGTPTSTSARDTAPVSRLLAPPLDIVPIRVEPQATLANTDPHERALTFGPSFQKILAADFESALVALRRLPAGPDRDFAILLLLDTLYRRDPDRALTLARELVTTRDQSAIYSIFF